jgi:cobalt-zinc-cadmium efflux system outer membrane protein
MAQADILTAGLRENPLFFYDTTGVPYGSYSRQRPGEIEHSLSLVYPLDISSKRRARQQVARQAKRVLEAQYQDAVRVEIDNLYEDFIDVLAAHAAVRAAERSLQTLHQLVANAQARVTQSLADPEEFESLIIERETAMMLVDGEQGRLRQAKRELAALLNLPAGTEESLELRGTIRVFAPPPPPTEALIELALQSRPDLAAHRLGMERACADLRLAQADRFPDPYFLYTPWSYTDNSQLGLKSISTWGMGVFISIPTFNRNQGNIERSRLNILQTCSELAQRERQVIEDVRRAIEEYEDSDSDLARLDQILMPAVRRKRDRARRRFEAGQIDADDYLRAQRDFNSLVRYYRETLVRYRRSQLELNTAVGLRIMP